MRAFALLITAIVISNAVYAVDTQPASAPVADYSTPLKAVEMFVIASRDRNGELLRQSVAWESEVVGKIMHLNFLKEMPNEKMGELETLMQKTYPNDALHYQSKIRSNILGSRHTTQQQESILKQLPNAKVVVNHDWATVALGANVKYDVVFRNGKWLVAEKPLIIMYNISDTMRKTIDHDIEVQKRVKELMPAALDKFMADIKAGKFTTGADAVDAAEDLPANLAAQVEAEMKSKK